MVSGLVTSPCDQLRIFSGEARLMRMASKSAIVFCISNGLERNKVFLRFLLSRQLPVISRQLPVLCFAVAESLCPAKRSFRILVSPPVPLSAPCRQLTTGHWRLLFSVCRRAGRGLFLPGLDQLHIQAERLQFADQHVERLGHARLHGGFALDDGLVNLGAAIYVVGLRRQQLLQNERCAVSFERPDFHLSETLSAELRLAT